MLRTSLLLFIALLHILMTITAQTKTEIVIIVQNDGVSQGYVNAVMQTLTENLSDFNYNLIINDSTPSTEHASSIQLSFSLTAGTDTAPRIHLQHPELSISHISSLLHSPTDFSITGKTPSTARILTGIILYAVEDCESANAVLQKEARNSQIMQLYEGLCAIANDNLNEARAHFEKAAAQHADPVLFIMSNTNLAWVHIQTGQKDQAFRIFEHLFETAETLEWDTATQASIYANRAQLDALNFDYDSAIANMDTAIELAPQSAEFYTIRGQIILLIYEWDRAMDNFNTAIDYDTTYADAYFYRGILHYTLANRTNARDDFQQYLDLAPQGQHAGESLSYIDSIAIELEALGD